MEALKLEVLKVPLGIIRLLEIPFCILAFSTTAGYQGCADIKFANCSTSLKTCWSYPYAPPRLSYPPDCNFPSEFTLYSAEFYSSAVFFVFTGVVAFMFSSAVVLGYMTCWDKYASNVLFPKIDLLITAVLTLFWFAASCAWADGVQTLKRLTEKEAIKTGHQAAVKVVEVKGSWDYASLNVSLIVGFAMVGLWAANLWFVFKETRAAPLNSPVVTPAPRNQAVGGATSTTTTKGYQQ